MSGPKPPSDINPKQESLYTAPGKVFILGEYAVLAGLPALVATVPPRFGMKVRRVDAPRVDRALTRNGPPLARLEYWAEQQGFSSLSFATVDPHQGAGGFGASTAEFAMAYLAYAKENGFEKIQWQHAWSLYQKLMSENTRISPSGADLIAQWQGGVVFTDPSDRYCLDVWPLFDWSSLMVFSATQLPGRKVSTHQSLTSLENLGFPGSCPQLVSTLERILTDGIAAVRENDVLALGKAMDEYADALHGADLEISASFEDRQALRQLSGVVGVKGAGALLADAILVLVDPRVSNRNQAREAIVQVAESRGLKLISDGLTCQMGITCQS